MLTSVPILNVFVPFIIFIRQLTANLAGCHLLSANGGFIGNAWSSPGPAPWHPGVAILFLAHSQYIFRATFFPFPLTGNPSAEALRE